MSSEGKLGSIGTLPVGWLDSLGGGNHIGSKREELRMKQPGANLSVWADDKVAVLKIVGRANFTSSVDFKAVVQALRANGCQRFVLDLSECLLMDSTFLGVLAGMGLKFSSPSEANHAPTIELLHPNARIADLLENLGVAHLFKVVETNGIDRDHLNRVNNVPHQTDQREISRTCLEAHQTLMDINPANIPRFKDVAQFLAEDLKRKEP